MVQKGSCHCGKVAFEVQGQPGDVIECNCSYCQRKGYLLWFTGRDQVKLLTGEDNLATYTFNRHEIQHKFCPTCGCAPFGFGTDPSGNATAAINVRCLDTVDLEALNRIPHNGRDG